MIANIVKQKPFHSDFLGRPLYVGNKVAVVWRYGHRQQMAEGKVIRHTPKRVIVRILYKCPWSKSIAKHEQPFNPKDIVNLEPSVQEDY